MNMNNGSGDLCFHLVYMHTELSLNSDRLIIKSQQMTCSTHRTQLQTVKKRGEKWRGDEVYIDDQC